MEILTEGDRDVVLHTQSKLIIDYLRPLLQNEVEYLQESGREDKAINAWGWLQGIDLHLHEMKGRVDGLKKEADRANNEKPTCSTVSG